MVTIKKNMDRRTFLKTTGVGGASLALSAGLAGNIIASEEAQSSSSKKMPTRILGKSGIPVSILSLGGIDWTTNQSLLRMGINMGATLLDTSDVYENGLSEIGIGQYFSKYPEDRKKVFLCTKAEMKEPQQVSKAIDQALERMHTDYLDLFLLTGRASVEDISPELKNIVEKKKKEGKIKLFGFSSHRDNEQAMARSIALGWIDALMIMYNYIIMQKDNIKKYIDACAEAGIGLIAIKTQAKGPGAQETPQELEAISHFMDKGYSLEQAKLKAVWNDERITSICSRIDNLTILKDNVAAATDNVKLSLHDFGMLKMLADSERSNYCQGCGKCVSAMSAENRIPDIMRYMMYYKSYGDRDRARNLFRELPRTLRDNLASFDYSNAESACPHGIQIGKIMREAAEILV